ASHGDTSFHTAPAALPVPYTTDQGSVIQQTVAVLKFDFVDVPTLESRLAVYLRESAMSHEPTELQSKPKTHSKKVKTVLSSPIWTAIGVFVAIITLFVAILAIPQADPLRKGLAQVLSGAPTATPTRPASTSTVPTLTPTTALPTPTVLSF